MRSFSVITFPFTLFVTLIGQPDVQSPLPHVEPYVALHEIVRQAKIMQSWLHIEAKGR